MPVAVIGGLLIKFLSGGLLIRILVLRSFGLCRVQVFATYQICMACLILDYFLSGTKSFSVGSFNTHAKLPVLLSSVLEQYYLPIRMLFSVPQSFLS